MTVAPAGCFGLRRAAAGLAAESWDVVTAGADFACAGTDFRSDGADFDADGPDFGPDGLELCPDGLELCPAGPDFDAAELDFCPAGPELCPAGPELCAAGPDFGAGDAELSAAEPEFRSARPDFDPAEPDPAADADPADAPEPAGFARCPSDRSDRLRGGFTSVTSPAEKDSTSFDPVGRTWMKSPSAGSSRATTRPDRPSVTPTAAAVNHTIGALPAASSSRRPRISSDDSGRA
ncbi:hypothetical protein GCM10010470_25890 [Saccharopolyspora taberi]|uniref:Uncharacterized protein n=1 Tax=Saccharopolyspora taberi TaxID=60895 RepID=A0ABN3VBW3_9PSEU